MLLTAIEVLHTTKSFGVTILTIYVVLPAPGAALTHLAFLSN